MQRKIEKKSFVCEIIVSELVALNFLYKEENISHRQSMLTNSLKNLQSANIDFFQLNYVQRDEQIW